MANRYNNYNDIEDLEDLPPIRNMPIRRRYPGQGAGPRLTTKREPDEIIARWVEQADGQKSFDFTYNASRHERQWIENSLGIFFEGQWLDDLLRLVKGGKEAHVYQCLANPSAVGLHQPYIAAKVYRPRKFRNLKNDHVYRQGRNLLDSDGNLITDDGMLHAIHCRSNYGLELLHASWIEHEFQALQRLHTAGANVPLPLERGNNAILMEYIGNQDIPAPTLNSIDLYQDEAKLLFERVLRNIEIMLAHGLVHGDLSAFNILYWNGEITLIDFPQVIDPEVNSNAYKIFERDVIRVCEYFTRQGVKSNSRRLAADLWSSFGHRVSPGVYLELMDE